MKRFAAFLLALFMVLSLATTAFAEETKNDSITINNAKVGETYSLYKLFNLSVNSETDPTAYTYTVNEAWAEFFRAPKEANGTEEAVAAGPGYQHIIINDVDAVTLKNDTEAGAAALAKAAADWEGKPNAIKTVTVSENQITAVFSDLEDGYWLVTSTLGTIAMTETTPDKNAVTINEKNPVDTVTKLVEEDSKVNGEDAWGTENDAQIGDTVNFKSEITLHKGTRNVKVTDTMTDGLTYNKDAAIADLTENTDYTITENDHGFVITFTENYLNNLSAETKLTLTYTAILNKNAINNAIVDQTNKIVLTYGDKQSVEATTTTTTHKFTVNKYATDVENLAGAVFSLKKGETVVNLFKLDDNNYRVAKTDEEGAVVTFTTVASGDIVIWGLDSDSDYTLEETKAPEGYNMLSQPVNVTWVDKNTEGETVDIDNTVIDVENKAGTQLPSTGGMGTTLFYIFGGILVVGAAVLLVTKKRMANAE